VKAVVIAGPTGAGKSRLAIRVAESLSGEIVNYDSVQIYRGFDIGSAKPPAIERSRVPHHLFDIVDADEEFNAADYAARARDVLAKITSRKNLPILVGGTFFYLRALLSGLPEMPGRDPEVRRRLRAISDRPRGPARLHAWLSRVDRESAARIPSADRHRIERALEVWIASGSPISAWKAPASDSPSDIDALQIGLTLERGEIVRRLDARVEEMYRAGLVDETRGLLSRYPRSSRPFGAIGYREAAAVVAGELAVAEAIAETKRRTRGYSKRQMTWLRSDRNVQWISGADAEDSFRAAMRLVERFQLD
jgi:tRNA dimethylallyltransferase